MRKRVFSVELIIAAIFCIATLNIAPGFAAEFTARMTDQDGDRVRLSTITIKGSFYRMDMEEYGEKISVIVDQDAGLTRVILHSEKTFMEIKSQDPQSLMNDPFQAAIYMADNGESKLVGTETINGLGCDKFVISMSGQDVMNKWVSQKYNFPVKIEHLMTENKFVEITDIAEGPVDDSLFQPPEGYTKWIDPADLPVEIPEWAKDLSSEPVMTPPFEKDMTPGEIVRIPVTAGQAIWVKGESSDKSGAVARAIAFKDGRPNKEPSWYNNFAMQGTICTRSAETPIEADEIVLYVFEGNVHVTAKYFPMKEETVKAGGEFRFLSESSDYVETRFVNVSDNESECVVSFFKDGVDVSESPVKYRTYNIEKKGKNSRNTFNVDNGNEVVIKITKGEMIIKMGQYDSFEF